MGRHDSETTRPARLSCTIRATEEQVSDIAYNVQGERSGGTTRSTSSQMDEMGKGLGS